MMIKILVVSENRRIMKTICESFNDYENILFELEYNGANAFEKILAERPDIIIIDSRIRIPIHRCLIDLKICQWDYKIFIIGSVVNNHKLDNIDIKYIEYSNISNIEKIVLKDSNNKSVEEELDDVNYSSKDDYIIKPEFYYICISKYLGNETVLTTYKINELKSKIETIGTPEIFTVMGQDIIIVFKKSDIKLTNGAKKVHDMICYTISNQYSSIYADKIYWNQVNTICRKVLENINYTYFFIGQAKDIMTILDNKKDSDFNKYYEDMCDLLELSLKNNVEDMKELLKRIYLKDIKETFDFNAINNIRSYMDFIKQNLLYHNKNEVVDFKSDVKTIEEEYSTIDTFLTDISKNNYSVITTSIVADAIIYAIRNYEYDEPLEEVSRMLYITKIHLNRTFKLQTNITFLQFIKILRIFIAKQYLNEYEYKINEISDKVGYTDSHYFGKLFKKETGLTPKEFRKLRRK